MGSRAVPISTVFWLTLRFCPAHQNLYDPAVYLSFFRQVAGLKQVSGLRQPTLQGAIGLTEQEVQILNGLAADCELKSRPFANAVGLLTFEARLRAVESEDGSAWLAQQRKHLDSQRDEMVRQYIQQLKVEFGDSRFEVLDAYIRSRKADTNFFPPLTAQGGPAPVVKRR